MEGINEVRNWSWELPTEPGLYLACYGDVVTHENTRTLEIPDRSKETFYKVNWGFIKKRDFNDSGWKFARLLFTGSELEKLEGA